MLNLNKKLEKKRKPRKSVIFFRIIIILLILSAAILIPAKIAYQGFQDVKLHSKAIASAYQAQNFGQMVTETKATKGALQKVNISLNFMFWLRIIPVVGGYYGDVVSLTGAGVNDLQAFSNLLDQLKPSEKELGFLGAPLAGQDRITQGIKVLEKSIPYLPSVQGDLKKGADQVKDIDVNKYPDHITVNGQQVKVKESISLAKDFIGGIYEGSVNYQDALKQMPAILGTPTPKTYLLLFQNDKEIRPTGGFMTAYAFVTINNGKISTTTSDDIYHLDEQLLAVCQNRVCPLTPPAPIVKYLPEVSGKPRTAWSMRDSNISPDVPTSVKQFESMYKLLGKGLPFDGVILIDSQVVEELIAVTGEINILGTPYSSKVDSRCNCPNVIYELESYAEVAAKGSADRKSVLGVLMQQVLGKLIGSSTQEIPQAIQTIVNLANDKHILFYMHDQKTQDALTELNWTGEIKAFDGDYLHINDANFAGGKTNLYVNQTVTQEISLGNGKVTKKVTIEYKNPQPFNTWLNGINRDYVRFYVPLGSKLTYSKGSDVPVTTITDLGKTVFEAFVTVRPQNSRTLQIQYDVPYDPKGTYNLMIQKQPGAKDFDYVVKINGSTKEDFELSEDREFKFKL